jgi:hypothetical protein
MNRLSFFGTIQQTPQVRKVTISSLQNCIFRLFLICMTYDDDDDDDTVALLVG